MSAPYVDSDLPPEEDYDDPVPELGDKAAVIAATLVSVAIVSMMAGYLAAKIFP